MTTGLLVVVAVLLLGGAVGLWRRGTDGRLRPVAAPPPGSGGRGAGEADVTAGAGEGVVESGAGAEAPEAQPGERIDAALLASLGVVPAPATLLQFSTAFCAPCRAVRRVCTDVAAMLPGVRHVEVDAESHLDEVRALGIWRTPTLLVLDADGRVVKRATGVPGKPHLIAAVADLLSPSR
ncbi:TlpA family protein disulfide reductase [Jidongwangia harbinensis]|uniref:TlpA family protein disulfide reductase n=1 Tax=Jidongwangia harbinensis TaxID=2878561 RepID=UPI001CDA22FE|nr:thioredoxin family protein [Jidongwangia harbinensis]MCA2212468.1 thioredoxin family protein [Jidongwangia harbinensis]